MGRNRNDIYLGIGRLYYNNVLLGIPEAEVTVNYTQTLIEGKAGDMKGMTHAEVSDEEMVVTAVLSALSLTDMETAFGRSAGSKETLSTVLHYFEEVKLNTQAAAKTLSNDNLITGSVVVTSLDGSTIYALTTDYLLTEATGIISRVTSGTGNITLGQTVDVDYRFTDTNAQVLKVGGADIIEQQLVFAIKDKDGAIMQLVWPKAVRNDATDIPFSREGKANITMAFKILADPNLPKGEQLMSFIKEA